MNLSFSRIVFAASIAFVGVSSAQAAFPDVPAYHAYANDINYLEELAVVEGYDDGSFKPEQTVNRVEFLKMLLTAYTPKRANQLPSCDAVEANFTDTDMTQWYGQPLVRAVCYSLVDGYDDGTFRPGNTINYAEVAKIVFNASESLEIDDTQSYTHWYEPYTSALQLSALTPPTITLPNQELTRGEMAFIISRARQMNQLGTVDATLPEENIMPKLSTATEAMTLCEAEGGHWVAAYNECEYMPETLCRQTGGLYDTCASPCRNQADAQACIMMCVSVCKYSFEQPEVVSDVTTDTYVFDTCGDVATYADDAWMDQLETVYSTQYYPNSAEGKACYKQIAQGQDVSNNPSCNPSILEGASWRQHDACYSDEGQLFVFISPHGPAYCGQILRYDTAQQFLIEPEGDYCISEFGKREGEYIWFTGGGGDAGHGRWTTGKYYYNENRVFVTERKTVDPINGEVTQTFTE